MNKKILLSSKLILFMSVFSFLLAQTGPTSGYDSAMRLYRDKNYDLAIKEFQSFADTAPSANENDKEKISFAIYMKSISYYRLEQYDKTIIEMEKVVQEYKESKIAPKAAYQIARIFYLAYSKKNHDYFSDKNIAMKRVVKVPTYVIVLEKLRAVEKLFPKCNLVDDALFLEGLLYEEERKFAEAENVYNRILTDFVTSSKVKETRKRLNAITLRQI